jgi:predicted protein tyrosine phosphatase
MKAVCLCQDANSRSVTCAYILKIYYNIDALSCGWNRNSKETLEMLFEWADTIFVMQRDYIRHVSKKYHLKVHVIDVGPDKWFVLDLNKDLICMIQDSLAEFFRINEVKK